MGGKYREDGRTNKNAAEDANAERKKRMDNRKKRNKGKNREFSESGTDKKKKPGKKKTEKIRRMFRGVIGEMEEKMRQTREKIRENRIDIIGALKGEI